MQRITAIACLAGAALALPAAAAAAPGPSLVQTQAPPAKISPGAVGIAAADFDEDEVLDVVTANGRSNDVSLALGTGDGFEAVSAPKALGKKPAAVAAPDLNGDGHADLALANEASDDLAILLGDGSGGFAQAGAISVGKGPRTLEAGDIDRDGAVDLVTTNGRSEDLTVVFGDGSGKSAATRTLKTSLPNCSGDCIDPRDAVIAELTGDGMLDIAVAESIGVTTIFQGDGARNLSQASLVDSGTDPEQIVAASLNADATTDLATAEGFDTFAASVLFGDGLGGFEVDGTNAFQDNGLPNSLDAADVDLDGDVDLVMTDDARYLALFLNRGDGEFSGPRYRPAGHRPSAATVADFTGDGRPDLAVAHLRGDVALFANGDRPEPAGVKVKLDGYSAASGTFSGALSSKDPSCMRGRVQLFRTKKGHDAYEGGDTGADARGRFRLDLEGSPDGTYYAQINRREVPTGRCEGARSNRVRVP